MTTKDCNGAELKDGDSIQLTRDLKVKGTAVNLKRGTTIRGIRLTHKPEEIECRLGKSMMVLKTAFVKKLD